MNLHFKLDADEKYGVFNIQEKNGSSLKNYERITSSCNIKFCWDWSEEIVAEISVEYKEKMEWDMGKSLYLWYFVYNLKWFQILNSCFNLVAILMT